MELALGKIVYAFIQAQKYYLNKENDRLIPLEVWDKLGISNDLLDVGLAEKKATGYYIVGSKDQFNWLIQRQEAGKKGGRPKRNKGQMEKATVNGTKPTESGSNPHYSLLITHNSLLNNKNNNIAQNEFARFDFDAIYKKYPRKLGKSEGLRKCKVQIKSQKDYENLKKAVDNYARYCIEKIENEKFIKHFSSFMSVWRDWIEMPEQNKDFAKNDDVFALLREDKNATTVL